MTEAPQGTVARQMRCGLLGRYAAWLTAALLAPDLARADDPLLLYNQDGFRLQAYIEAGLNGVVERNLFWDLAVARSSLRQVIQAL